MWTTLLLCRLYLLPWFVGNAEVLQWCAVVYPGVFPVTSGSLFKCSFLCLCGEIFCSEKLCYQNVGSFENFCWRVHTFVRYLLMWFRNLWLGNKFLCTFWYLTIRTCIFSSVIDIFGQNLSITFGNLCLPQQARIGQWATGWKIEGFGRFSCGHNQRSMSRG